MPAKKASSKSPKKDVLAVNKRLIPESTKREHKEIERYSDKGESSKMAKPIVIKKGKGKKLDDIEIVAKHISKRTKSDPLLRSLHGVLIGRVNKTVNVKENLGNFSGVLYDDELNREKLCAKLEKHQLTELREFLSFLGLEKGGKTKEDIVNHLVDYLEKPHGDVAETSDSPKKRKRSASPSKSPTKKASKSPRKKKAKKDPNAPKRAKSAYIFFSMDKREEVVDKHGKESIGDTAKRIASLWKKASGEEKKKYEAKAEKDKKRWEKEKKEYEKKSKE